MTEIWTEVGRFKVTNQRLADQVRTITKNDWFSDLEIVEIHKQIRKKHQQTPTTVNETIKPETLNQTLHDNDSCTVNTKTQTRTQEEKEKTNVDTIKRIMSEKKNTLPSLRNQDWKTVKSKPEKWTTYWQISR